MSDTPDPVANNQDPVLDPAHELAAENDPANPESTVDQPSVLAQNLVEVMGAGDKRAVHEYMSSVLKGETGTPEEQRQLFEAAVASERTTTAREIFSGMDNWITSHKRDAESRTAEFQDDDGWETENIWTRAREQARDKDSDEQGRIYGQAISEMHTSVWNYRSAFVNDADVIRDIMSEASRGVSDFPRDLQPAAQKDSEYDNARRELDAAQTEGDRADLSRVVTTSPLEQELGLKKDPAEIDRILDSVLAGKPEIPYSYLFASAITMSERTVNQIRLYAEKAYPAHDDVVAAIRRLDQNQIPRSNADAEDMRMEGLGSQVRTYAEARRDIRGRFIAGLNDLEHALLDPMNDSMMEANQKASEAWEAGRA